MERSISLRAPKQSDVSSLAALGRNSFVAAFGTLYDPEDLSRFLDEVYSEPVIAAELADPLLFHRLAFSGDKLAGFCKLRFPSGYAHHSDARRPMALQQLYTDPAMTGLGIGARLMEWALDMARECTADAIQLSVWSGNTGAQRFYARHGFVKIADIDFWVGEHRDDELLLERKLG